MIVIKTEEGRLFHKALLSKYQAQIDEAKATLTMYVNRLAAIGEHSDLMEEFEKWVGKLSDAVDKYDAVNNLFDVDGETETPIKG
jgi:hypothetical protein